MDTTVALEELVLQLGLDLVFLVQRGRLDATTSSPNAQDAKPRASTVFIQRARPKAPMDRFSRMTIPQQNGT